MPAVCRHGRPRLLPAGDMALTRRATKYSGKSATVVRFSRSRGRYERQGILVEISGYREGRGRVYLGCGRPGACASARRQAPRRAGPGIGAADDRPAFWPSSRAAPRGKHASSPPTPPREAAGGLAVARQAAIWKIARCSRRSLPPSATIIQTTMSFWRAARTANPPRTGRRAGPRNPGEMAGRRSRRRGI